MELGHLIAREQIRDTLALYNWSGDALRLSELARAFCDDGTLEIRGLDPLVGRAAIVAFLGGETESDESSDDDETRRARLQRLAAVDGRRRIVRHNVTNIRFVELTTERASVSSYFSVFTEIGLDHYGRYRDLFVPVGDAWLIEHRYVSTDWRAANSTMAPPDSVRSLE